MNAFRGKGSTLLALCMLLGASACDDNEKKIPPVPVVDPGNGTTSGGSSTAGRTGTSGARAAGSGGSRVGPTAGNGAKPGDAKMDAGGKGGGMKDPPAGESDAGLDDSDGGGADAGVEPTFTNVVTWVGTTSQGMPITFDVADEGLTQLGIAYAFTGCDGNNNAKFLPPVPLAMTFSVTFPLAGATSLTFAGTFLDANRASGTLLFVSAMTAEPACGAGGLTWTATRE